MSDQKLSTGEAVGFTLIALLVTAVLLGLAFGIGYFNGYPAGRDDTTERHHKLLIEKGLGHYKDGKFEWSEWRAGK